MNTFFQLKPRAKSYIFMVNGIKHKCKYNGSFSFLLIWVKLNNQEKKRKKQTNKTKQKTTGRRDNRGFGHCPLCLTPPHPQHTFLAAR